MLYYRLMAVWRYSFLCTGLVLGVIRTPCANRALQCPVRILPHKKTHPGDKSLVPIADMDGLWSYVARVIMCS